MSLATSFDQYRDQLLQRFYQLTPRDRFALVVLGTFLLVFGIGYGVWKLHTAANNAQLQAIEQRELLLWMRSQAPHIQQSSGEQVPLSMLIQTTAQNQGLTISQNSMGEQVQVTTSHPSFAVLGSWLSRLAEQGVSINQLDINQNPAGELQLKALLAQTSS